MKNIQILLSLSALVMSGMTMAADPVTGLLSDSHQPGVADSSANIRFSWDVSTDPTVIGYAFTLDMQSETLPAAVPLGDQNVNSVTLSTETLEGDGVYYFHIRSVDSDGLGSAPVHLGPFIIDTQAPTASATPPGGSYSEAQSVVLSADETAMIFYTTDGSTPTTESTEYTGPISVQSSTTIRFLAQDVAGNLETVVHTETYDLDGAAADTTAPSSSASPAGGMYTAAQQVQLSANEAAIIYFTVDGSIPDQNSPVYRRPLTITSDITLRFFAVDQDGNQESAVNTETYTVRSTVRNALGINNLGASLETNAHFAPVVSSNSGILGNEVEVPNSDEILVRAVVEADTAHIGMAADLLLVAVYVIDNESFLVMREGEAGWQIWDGQIASLVAAARTDSLTERQNLDVLEGSLSVLVPGALTVFTGYRLDDGSLVVNALEPIRFVIN